MVKVITLEPGDLPPVGAPCIVMEWSMGKVTSFVNKGRSLHYVVGQPKHRFWSTEAILLAVRMGFDEIYYVGRPSEVAWPSDVQKYVPTQPAPQEKRRRSGKQKTTPRRKGETRASL